MALAAALRRLKSLLTTSNKAGRRRATRRPFLRVRGGGARKQSRRRKRRKRFERLAGVNGELMVSIESRRRKLYSERRGRAPWEEGRTPCQALALHCVCACVLLLRADVSYFIIVEGKKKKKNFVNAPPPRVSWIHLRRKCYSSNASGVGHSRAHSALLLARAQTISAAREPLPFGAFGGFMSVFIYLLSQFRCWTPKMH